MRNLFIYAAATLVLVVVSVSIYYQAFAQSDDGRLAHIYEGTELGDEDIIARIGDQTIKRQQFRQAFEYQVAVNEEPNPTADVVTVEEMKAVAKDTAILLLVHDMVEYAEAVDRGFTATDAEVETYIEQMKAMCAGPEGADCQALIRKVGLTPEKYWEKAFDEYKRGLTITKMKTAHVNALYPDGHTYDEMVEVLEAFEDTLRNDDNVIWEDEDLKFTYQQAAQGNVND